LLHDESPPAKEELARCAKKKRHYVPEKGRTDVVRRKPLLVLAASCLVGWSSVIAGISTSASAASGTPTTLAGVLKQIKGMNATQRQATLIKDAQAEGSVLNLSTQDTVQVLNASDPVFTQETGIKINITHVDTTQIISQIAQQVAAGQVQQDVIFASDQYLYEAAPENLIQKYSMPWITGIPKQFVFPRWYDAAASPLLPTWNTSVVKTPPKDFVSVLKNYPGLIALMGNQPQWFGAVSLWMIKTMHMTQDQVNSLFQNAAQHGRVFANLLLAEPLLDSGSLGIVPADYVSVASASIASGAPVAFTPAIAPVVQTAAGVAIVTNDPHPAAALLYANFRAGEDQKIAYQASKLGGTNTQDTPTMKQTLNVPDSDVITVTGQIYAQLASKWIPMWNRDLGIPG
jgi:iron(III) transport system substrate-binding protein